MKHISSVQNQSVKRIIELQSKAKARKESNCFTVEGLRELQLAFMADYEATHIYWCPDILTDLTFKKWISKFNLNSIIISVSIEVYNKMVIRSSTEGVIGILKQKNIKLEDWQPKNNCPFLLVLESIEKPGNLGAILRTADASGVDAVIVSDPHTDIYNPNVIRSSVGEENMTPYEMMLSESQERMLIILEDEKEKEAKKIFDKWDLDFVIIGKTTNTNNLTLKFNNKIEGEIPIEALASKAPVYDRKWIKKKPSKIKIELKSLKKINIEDALVKILSSPNHSNKSWVTNQYDQMVMCDTVQKSGSDAAIIRIHNKDKAIAVSVDSSANYCKSYPETGGKQIVCENWRNLIAVGAKPIAITNCLNFGNPEKQEIMGEFAECLQGLKEACNFLKYPVVSGNVSFYNGTNKKNIHPTPVIGGIGLIKKLSNPLSQNFKKTNSAIVLIGKTFGHIEQSCFLKENYSITEGMPPEINLLNEKNNGESLLKLINKNLILSAHDISDGGLITALSEMTFTSNIGAKIHKPKKLTNLFKYFFGEDQARYIVEIQIQNLPMVEKMLKEGNIYYENIGFTQENYFEIEGELKISTKDLFKVNNQWYNNY